MRVGQNRRLVNTHNLVWKYARPLRFQRVFQLGVLAVRLQP